MAKIERSHVAEKVKEALELLNEASGEKKDEILRKLRNVYADIKDAEERVVEKAQDAARDINVKVHNNPWPYVGAAALGGVVIGLLIHFARRSGR